ncbi:MAG: beta-N-acetylglucosaminidase domain-containing protein [Pseudomonadota bacterium]
MSINHAELQAHDNHNVGIIEGFYGHEWSWAARTQYARFLKDNGMAFYIYAPKSDKHLREQWQTPWPNEQLAEMQALSLAYEAEGVEFGLSLSPMEIYRDWNAESKQQLIQKIDELNQVNHQILCVLFDDMWGDIPDLAELQIDITHTVKQHSRAKTIIMCPSYYTFEPILEELFGARPERYWEDLGAGLDPDIEVFWTGDLVCSTEYSVEGLSSINAAMQRPVTLWDNYPVNDGKKTSPFLHLWAFENRPSELSQCTRRHVANPMNAPFLSKIPLITLSDVYTMGIGYNPRQSQKNALHAVCGEELAQHISQDIHVFQEQGLNALAPEEIHNMLQTYQAFSHPCAHEICLWLQGHYAFDPACLTG